jgi:predicted phage tail protein
MPELHSERPENAAILHDFASKQAQIVSCQDRTDAIQVRIEKRLEQTIVNSSSIIATQERIKDKQAWFDMILKNQGMILDDLQMSCSKLEELGRRVAYQTATIVSYQQIIISNQQKLDQVLTNQAKILANQEQHVIANAERILANDEVILAGLQKLLEAQ